MSEMKSHKSSGIEQTAEQFIVAVNELIKSNPETMRNLLSARYAYKVVWVNEEPEKAELL